MESIRNWSNIIFQWTKTLYQNNFKHNAFVLLEGYNCNKLYEITPKKNFLWDPEGGKKFKGLKLH